MKKADVPQQSGLMAGCREVNYAVDDDGSYTLAPSSGWEAKNVTLLHAWEAIIDQLEKELADIRAGRKSPLCYHMVKNQMDPALLAKYSGVPRWRVKRHLKPAVFAKLDQVVLTGYAELFGISIDELCRVPDSPDLALAEFDHSESR